MDTETDKNEVHILWTNADPSVAYNMVFMYAGNAVRNKWWDEITVILWGPTQELAVQNQGIREHIKELQNLGVKFSACMTCAIELETKEDLEQMGVEVIRWGKKLTDKIKNKDNIIYV